MDITIPERYDGQPISMVPDEILLVIIAKLHPIDCMILCLTSHKMHSLAYSADLRGRRLTEESARNGCRHLMEYAAGFGPRTKATFRLAAGEGSIETVAYLLDVAKTDKYTQLMTVSAAQKDRLDVLKLLHYADVLDPSSLWSEKNSAPVIRWVLGEFPDIPSILQKPYVMIRSGDLAVVQRFHETHNVDFTNCEKFIVAHGNYDIFCWFVAKYHYRAGDLFAEANTLSRIDIMDWLHQRGYTCKRPRFISADVLEWFSTHGYAMGDIYMNIHENRIYSQNIIECYDWALQHGFNMSAQNIYTLSSADVFLWGLDNGQIVITPKLVEHIIQLGKLNILKIIHERGYPWLNQVDYLSKDSYHTMFAWAVSNGLKLTPELYVDADLTRAMYLQLIGCPDDGICALIVAKTNHSSKIANVLSFLVHRGYRLDSRVCLEANIRNSPSVMRIVHDIGCECCSTCTYAK